MSHSEPLKHYYDREWKRLQTDAKSFANAYPEQAGHLHLDAPFGRDPTVDHLMQGCTYLSAQIHRYIDHNSHGMALQWVSRWWPQMVQDVPSYSVAQCHVTGLSTSAQVLPAGTALLSAAVGKESIRCRFETTTSLTAYPFEVRDIVLNETRTQLTVTLHVVSDRAYRWDHIDRLSFYLSDDFSEACVLYRWLRQHNNRIVFEGEQCAIDLVSSFPIQRYCPTDLLAHQTLFDYFVFPQQYLFFDLTGFDRFKSTRHAKQINLILFFDKPVPHALLLHKDSVALNATVITNRFSMACEPIRCHENQCRYQVQLDHAQASAYRLLTVSSVKGVDQPSGRVTDHTDFIRSRDKDETDRFYIGFDQVLPSSHILSIDAVACNGFYPNRYVPKNGLSLASSAIDKTCHATNILVPTPMLSPSSDVLSDRLFELMTMRLTDLTAVDTLKHLLRLFHWSKDPQHARRIDAIESIDMRERHHIIRGGFVQVMEIELCVHNDGYVSSADAFLFGDVLYAFFKAHAAMNQTIRLRMRLLPQEEVLVWHG